MTNFDKKESFSVVRWIPPRDFKCGHFTLFFPLKDVKQTCQNARAGGMQRAQKPLLLLIKNMPISDVSLLPSSRLRHVQKKG